MLIKKKPPTDQKLTFAPMGKKPAAFAKNDVENAADAKKPGDKKEDAKDLKKQTKKGKSKNTGFFAKKAATALAKK